MTLIHLTAEEHHALMGRSASLPAANLPPSPEGQRLRAAEAAERTRRDREAAQWEQENRETQREHIEAVDREAQVAVEAAERRQAGAAVSPAPDTLRAMRVANGAYRRIVETSGADQAGGRGSAPVVKGDPE